MAKELPYFKFEPNQWENGNIQICSREEKGLFMDLCAMYWSRLGDVPFKLAIQKLCDGNATAFDSLCKEGIISIVENNICIDFLNEQLQEFEDISQINSKNAKEGWVKRRKNKQLSERNATALISQCENDAIKEDKIKEDNINNPFSNEKVDWDNLKQEFINLTGKNIKLINQKTKRQILARLKEGYTKDDFWKAIVNCSNDTYHKESNYKHFTLEFISRPDKLEKFLSIKN